MRIFRFLLAAVFAAAFFGGCSLITGIIEFKDPVIKTEKVELLSFDFEKATVRARLRIENPNAFPVPVLKAFGSVLIGDRTFFTFETPASVTVPAAGSAELIVDTGVPFADIPDIIRILTENETVKIGFSANINCKTEVINVNIPFSYQCDLRLPRLPKISLKGTKVERISLTGATVIVTLQAENPNMFPVQGFDLSADVLLSGTKITTVSQSISIPAGSSASMPFLVNIDAASVGIAIFKSIKANSFDLGFSGILKTPLGESAVAF